MNPQKTPHGDGLAFLVLGLVFLASGATFLTVGLVTKLFPLWVMAPGLLGMGIVFLVLSRKRQG